MLFFWFFANDFYFYFLDEAGKRVVVKKDPLDSGSEDEKFDESSSDEDEDEFGDLITEDIEAGINQVLKTLDENPEKLLDKSTTFFRGVEAAKEAAKNEKLKPIYLKDYHRLQLLAREKTGFNSDSEDEEQEPEYPEGKKPYAIQQKEDKEKILAEINKAVEGKDDSQGEDNDKDDESDDDFFTKRKEQRTVETVELPNPQEDSSKFLNAYLEKKAWLPRAVDKSTGEFVIPTYSDLVEDDDEFDDNAETYENAYNMRFEDPNANEIMSYARTQNTIRREKSSSRKRKRDAKIAALKQEEEKQDAELQHLKNKKATQLIKKMDKIKSQFMEDPDAEELAKIFDDEYLDGDFEGDEWDKRMTKMFGEEFYSQTGDLPDGAGEEDDYAGEGEKGEANDNVDFNMDADFDPSTVGKSKSQLKKEEKLLQKQEKQKLLEVAQRVVDENVDLLIKEEGSKSLKKRLDTPRFKYRDVSPDSFGLTERDILLADDKDLNNFIGIKKLATYRDPEKKEKDRRKFGKSKRVKEWRMSVFNTKETPDDQYIQDYWSGKKDKKPSKKQNSHKKQKK